MKLCVSLLSVVLAVNLLATSAPEGAGVRVAMRQAATEEQDYPVSLEDRKSRLKQLEESVSLALSQGQSLQAARTLARVGSLQLLLNDPQAALARYLQALDLIRDTPDSEIEVDNLVGSASAYIVLQKELTLAGAALDKALTVSKQAGYTLGEAEALLTLSDLQNLSDHALAVQTALKALELWKTLDNKVGQARTYIQIGTCYMAQSQVTEAEPYFAKALDIWRALNNTTEQAEALINLGFNELRQCNWKASVDFLSEAFALLDERAEPMKMGKIAAGMGYALNENGLPEQGVVQFQRALNYYRQAQDAGAIAYATWAVGRTYYLMGDYAQALDYMQQSLAPLKKDSVAAAPVFQYLGRIYLARGEYDAALDNLNLALPIYTSASNPKEANQVLALIGQVYDRKGTLGLARRHYQEALKGFTALSDRVNEAAVLYALGGLELKQKNYDVASTLLRQSIDVTENIRRVPTTSDLTAAFSATVHERYEAYIECLMKQHEAKPAGGSAVNAFETSELGRARALSELLNAMQTNLTPGLDPELAAREKSLRQGLMLKEGDRIRLLGENNRDALLALEKEVAQLEKDYAAVNETIRSRYPSYEEITRPSAWNLQQIQQQILADDDTVLLEYSIGSENSYAWAVTRDEIKSYKLQGENVINEAAKEVYDLLSTPAPDPDGKLAKASQRLAELVLTPVASSLNKQRIILVADGALNYIPFQLLPSPADEREPLVAKYEVVNVPSASILGQLRREKLNRQPPPKLLAAFGDPAFVSNYEQLKHSRSNEMVAVAAKQETPGGGLRDIELTGDSIDPSTIKPLVYSKHELANLREIAGAESFVATGFDASRETLEKVDLSKYSILHLATHGILDPKRPELSGFYLSMLDPDGKAQNGFMTIQDVYRLQAPVDLVVLSACRTGLGKDVRGEGLIGLTRGFMYAGASSVAAALWKVDDEATAELMKHFYENMLQRNMTPAAALRAAQNTIRRESQWQSPYYWAAFTLQGEYNQTIKRPVLVASSQTSPVVLLIGLLFVLSGVFGWWVLRRRLRRS